MTNIGALANVGKDIPTNVEQVSDLPRPIAELSGGKYDSVKIFKMGDGYYGDTGDFDFTANDLNDLMQKLRVIGATSLNFGELK